MAFLHLSLLSILDDLFFLGFHLFNVLFTFTFIDNSLVDNRLSYSTAGVVRENFTDRHLKFVVDFKL